MKTISLQDPNCVHWLSEAVKIALSATCTRSRCGTVIVKDGEMIGSGFNSPPKNFEGSRRCSCDKKILDLKVTDKTCCVHAEQRAIMDALSKNPEKVPGSRLYFIRIDDTGNVKFSGEPYCTICSKMALDVGIAEFVLYCESGFYIYGTEEYNTLSYKYRFEKIDS